MDNKRDERDEKEVNPHEQREPTPKEMRGMLCKPSDRNPPRERFKGMMI